MTTIKNLENMVEQSYELAAEIKRIEKEELTPKKEKLALLDSQILAVLEEHEMKSWKGAKGHVIRQRRYSVTTPKSIEDKQAFFSWLKAKHGDTVFWDKMGIHSGVLNSLYNEEMEAAKEAGDFMFEMPGVGKSSYRDTLSRRKV